MPLDVERKQRLLELLRERKQASTPAFPEGTGLEDFMPALDVQGPPQAPSELAGMRFNAPVSPPDALSVAPDTTVVPDTAKPIIPRPGVIPQGTTERLLSKVFHPQEQFEEGMGGVETTRRLLHNLGLGAIKAPIGVVGGLLEDPVETAKGLATFIPEEFRRVRTALPESLSGRPPDILKTGREIEPAPFTEEERKQARAELFEHPEGPIFAAAALGGLAARVSRIGRKTPKATEVAKLPTPKLSPEQAPDRQTSPSLALLVAARLKARAIQAAKDAGVKFDGFQELPKGKTIASFTDPKTEGSFIAEPSQVKAKLAKMRAAFEKGKKVLKPIPAQIKKAVEPKVGVKMPKGEKQPWEMSKAEWWEAHKNEIRQAPEGNWYKGMVYTKRGPHQFIVEQAIKEGKIKSHPDYPDLKPKPSITLSFMGANPEVVGQLGRNVVDAAKSISKSTSAMVEGIKGKPEIRSGVQAFKDVAIEHDRMIRNSEFTAKQLEKVIKDAVPDPKRQMLMTKAYEHKLKGQYWDQLTDLEKAMVRFASGEKAKLNKFVADNKIVQMLPESDQINHIKHVWQNPETLKPYRSFYGKFTKKAVGGHERKIVSIEQGEKLGLVHAETNLGKLIGLEWIDMMRAHQARQFLKSIYSIGAEKGTNIVLRKGGKPQPIRMLERWDLLEKQGLTDGYKRYSHPSLDKAMVFKVDGKTVILKGAVGVKTEIYSHLRAYMENPNYGTLSRLNFASKSLKLGMSLFHVSALGMQELANFRVPFKNIPRGLQLRKELGPELKLLHQQGLELFKGYEDLGYRNQFFEGLTAAGKAGNIATKPISLMRDFIFDVVQPGMKTSFAFDQLNKMLPRYLKGTGWTPEMVMDAVASGKPLPKQALMAARRVVQKADGHFSGEHWKLSLLETNRFMVKMYFSPEARKFWQGALLSPTWQREHLLVAKNVAKSFMPDKMIKRLGMEEIGPIKSQYRKYALGAISMIGSVDLWNQMSTYMMDGKAKHIWENPEGKGFAVRAWWNEPSYKVTDKNGKVRTVQGGPAYIRPLKSVFEVAEWGRDPFKKFAYKLSPAATAIGRQIFADRYRAPYKGIEDIPHRALDFILDVSTPIMVDQLVDVVQGKKTPVAGALPFFGFPTSKVKDVSAAQWKRRRGIERMAILDLYGAGKSKEAMVRRREWDKTHPDMRFTGKDINTDEIKRRRRYLARRGR